MSLNLISRILYRAARMTRDAQAVNRSIQTGSPAPMARRVVRKAVYRGTFRLTSRILRAVL